MSTSPVASQLEVLDLRHFSSRQLRPLLEAEAGLWRDRLHWDYTSSTELLLHYVESRILQGFVALERGRIRGYTFCVYEGHKAVIGDLFGGATGVDTARLLLQHVLELLRHSPGVDRVESQLLLFDAGQFADVFVGPEFAIYPRLFLECDLERPAGFWLQPAVDLAAFGLEMTRWSGLDYQAAGELIHACYVGHMDAKINDQYRSLHGSLRFLHNIVRFPGCGVFEANFSFVLREKKGGALVGIVLCSRVGPGVAHVTQLCISQAYRGRGIGRVLLNKSAVTLLNGGFDAITLTVTEANHQATRLYEQVGFRTKHRFDAMVMEPRRYKG